MIFLLFTYLITYSLATSNTVLLEKLAGSQLVKNYPTFYGTRMFLSAFKSARHISLTWVISIQYMPQHPTPWKSILKTFSHLSLVSQVEPFLLFPHKILYTTVQSTNRLHATTRMLSHSSKDKIFSKSLLTTTNSFITILIDGYNERLFFFSGNYSLLLVLAATVRPLLTHAITDLYNIIEYLMTTLNIKTYTLIWS